MILYLYSDLNVIKKSMNDFEIVVEIDAGLWQLHNTQGAIVELVQDNEDKEELGSREEQAEECTEISDDHLEDHVVLSVGLVLISSHNHLGENKYFEPKTGLIFQVDPHSLQASPVSGNMKHQNMVDKELQEAVEAYANKSLCKRSASGIYCKDDGSIVVMLSGQMAEPRNMWSASWKSEWIIKDNNLKGTMTAFSHCYEEGNVQLHSSKNHEILLENLTEMVKNIEEAESNFQISLAEAYSSLSQAGLKRLRRQLPITRMKMDWSKVDISGLGSELRSTSNKN